MSIRCTIDVAFPHFRRACKRAANRHRSLPQELAKIFAAIELDAVSLGDRIPGFGPNLHFRKIRVGVPLDRIPPSGGYRLILQLLEADEELVARCLDLYYKPDQSDIRQDEAMRLAADAAALQPDEPAQMP